MRVMETLTPALALVKGEGIGLSAVVRIRILLTAFEIVLSPKRGMR